MVGVAAWDLRRRRATRQRDEGGVLYGREAPLQEEPEEQASEDGLQLREELEGDGVDELQDEEDNVVVDEVDERGDHEPCQLHVRTAVQQRRLDGRTQGNRRFWGGTGAPPQPLLGTHVTRALHRAALTKRVAFWSAG